MDRNTRERRKVLLRSQLEPAASVHEAGHVIVGLALGGVLTKVSIQRDGTGRTEWFISPCGLPSRRQPAPTGSLFVAQLTWIVAGAVAEVLYGPRMPFAEKGHDSRLISACLAPDENPADLVEVVEDHSDLAMAFNKARFICCSEGRSNPSPKRIHAVVLKAEKKATECLVRHKEQVVKLADALLQNPRRRMTAAQIKSLFEATEMRNPLIVIAP
jgi:ATP-dependent Zn protease